MKKFLLFLLCMMGSQLLNAQTVGPLIQTQWDQDEPYNLMLPEVDGKHCLTSCGATAMAQICYYYRWPEEIWGSGHIRVDNGPEYTFDFYPVPVEYDKMLLTYDENSSEEAKMAVALLMRNIASFSGGLSVEQSYSPAPAFLTTSFDYDAGLMHLRPGYFSKEDMISIIRSELDAGRPVILGGSNGFAGHDFICDGYNDKDEFHFNYGWSGDYDGWSTLENCLFPINMSIDFNIKKNEGGERAFTLGCNRDFKWMGDNKIYGNYNFETYYSVLMQLQVALAVENTDTHEVQYFCHTNKDMLSVDDMGLLWELDADLPDGSYVLYPVGRDINTNSQWRKAYFRDLCQKEVALTVKNGVKTFANNNLNDYVKEGAVEVEGLCYELNDAEGTAKVTYRNDKYASYSGNIVIPETITINDKTYMVTAIGEGAFRDCKFLDQVVIGKNVTNIEWSAFVNIVANKVSFAEGSQLKTIDTYAFYCADIQKIILPEGLEQIGRLVFGNAHIIDIIIPSTVISWGEYCFMTTSLVSMHINQMTPPILDKEDPCFRYNGSDVGDFAPYKKDFAYGITSSVLYVPAGAKEAYAQADVWKDFGFILEPGDDDSFVKNITRSAIEIDNVLYQFNGIKKVAKVVEFKKDVDDVVLNNTIQIGEKTFDVVSIGEDVFNGTQYNRIVIPANVETIIWHAFNDVEIVSLEFEEGSHLKEIDIEGLWEITLKSPLVLPEGLKSLGSIRCKDVADITIPASVTSMGSENFFTNLKHLRVFWPEPLVVENLFAWDQFVNGNGLDGATLHVPVGTKELYANAEGWKLFPNIVEGNDDDTAIKTVNSGKHQADAIYTLDGRRVDVSNDSLLPRGIYIIGGKKVIK